ncbi:hypothetical protein ACWGOE_11315 [Leucobacter chromiiresistens]|uniref:DNA uptake lipoprotein n=1 Tax=Leucobacter chromiiresistens TaxID=1079994 RepID=A0A1H0YYX2_9MICO|nr:hypothetical protein SAMN04488565_1285 [Leucobacter chromiiresistens]
MSNAESEAPASRTAAAPAAARSAARAPEPGSAAASDRLGGLGRVLIAVYIVLALAATFRSVYQIIAKFDEAPLAYSLSALSGAVYIVATIALIKRRGVWRGIAWGALIFELCGVLVVGLLSILEPQLFGHPSVWSFFGSGYLFIPLVLPVLGLIWLRSTARAGSA